MILCPFCSGGSITYKLFNDRGYGVTCCRKCEGFGEIEKEKVVAYIEKLRGEADELAHKLEDSEELDT